MTDKRNIEDKIKESFEGINCKAPQGILENLNKELVDKDSLNEKVKESFEGLQVSVPEQVWEGVNKQLNIERAWRGINGMLIRRTIWRRTRRISSLILLLLFIGWGSFKFFLEQSDLLSFNERKIERLINEKSTQKEKRKNREQQLSKGGNLNRNKRRQLESKISKKKFIAEVPQTNENIVVQIAQGNQLQAKNTILIMDENKLDKVVEKELDVFEQMPILFVSTISNSSNITQILEIAHFEDSIFKEKNKFQRFEVGLVYSYNKTTLFNNETRRSFDQQSLISSEVSYAGSYGITGIYHFTQKHGITAIGYIQSETKQHYKTYLEGRYTEKDIRLDYQKLAMAYQYSFLNSIPSQKFGFIVKAGLYYAWLKKGTLNYNGISYSITDNYINSDIGVLLQAGQQLTKGRLVFEYGLNMERGLKNIFAGDGKTPADFDRSHTFRIGGYVSTRYKF